VNTICIRNKTSRAFALGDALGNRNLPALLRCLDEEMWEMQFDRDKSEIGLLYGLISKVRALLLLKEMLREGWLKPTENYNSFKAQLERVPASRLPADKRYNPLALNPYVLFKALPQVRNYSEAELVNAMDLLLRANQRLVSSGLDERLVLQQTFVQIVGAAPPQPSPIRAAA
jgi:DNA polymerase III delta subunit